MNLHSTYQKLEKKDRLAQFLVLISFLLTFSIVRIITYLQKLDFFPDISLQIGTIHIHHLVPGIFILLISGYIIIAYGISNRYRNILAVLFGFAAALTIDEFALWLYLEDVYFEKQGRVSVDAVIIIATLLTISYILSNVYDHKWVKYFKFS